MAKQGKAKYSGVPFVCSGTGAGRRCNPCRLYQEERGRKDAAAVFHARRRPRNHLGFVMMYSAMLPVPAAPLFNRLQCPRLGSYCCCSNKSVKLPNTAPGLPMSSSPRQSEASMPLVPSISQSVAAVILGDGSGTKLYPLTKRRAGGAIPLAAHYRLIDVVVSNCINSNITKIYALTQFNSTSLNAHLSRAYSTVGLGKDGFVEVLAAYQNLDDEGWFQGDADSIRRCLWVLEEYPVEDFLVLPGDHLYRMEYEKLIKAHRDSNADITVVLSLSENQRRPYSSSLKLNSKDQTLDSRRKLEGAQAPLMTTGGGSFTKDGAQDLRSMGIYVIKREALGKLLLQNLPHANDFKSEVIPGAVSMGMKVHTYTFNGYWEDMRDVEAFYQANLRITRKAPTSQGFNFYDREHPIYTLARCLPPTRITGAAIKDSVIGDGCVLNRCKINGSVIGMRACIGDGAVVEDTIVMGADIYQIDEDFRWCMTKKPCAEVPLGIGEQTQVRRAIIDKNARIGKNVKIVNADNVQEGDREESGYIITGGIVVVLKGAVIPDGSII